MLISSSIPSMFNGVSQQPAPLRHTSQAEIQENAFPSVAVGLSKRPPTIHLAKLTSTLVSNAFTHTINRDASERYEVVVTDGDLKVYDLISGVEKSVYFPYGKGYLNSADPSTGFSMTTIADYTFVINKSTTVAMNTSTVAPTNPVNVAYVLVAAAPAQHGFSIGVDGSGAGTSLSSTGGTQGGVADALVSALQAAMPSGYTFSRVYSSIVKIVRNDGGAVSVAASDTYNNQALKVISNGVARFSDLPPSFDTGYTIKVQGDPGDTLDNYYVEFKNGGWVEAVKPGSVNAYDLSTLPHQLVRNGDGTFTFSRGAWSPRQVGDDTSNPLPSFVGRVITDIFFFRNRLGMLSDENVIMSRSGNFFSFFGETARALLDSDPIDVTTPGTKVSLLKYAIPFNKVLLLFSDQTQFQLSAGDVLSPKTVHIDVATSFECSTLCRPVAVGQELFFPVLRGNYTGVREYYVDNNNVSNDAVDATAHIPHYIPAGVFKLAESSNEDMLAAVSNQERNALYLYKFYWSKNEKMQSAWFKFVFDSSDVVLNADFIANKLYLVIQRADGIYLEYMDLQAGLIDTGMGFLVNLDRRVSVTGSYNATTDTTTWTLPYADNGGLDDVFHPFNSDPAYTTSGNFAVVLGPSFSGKVGTVLNTTRPTASTISAAGNFSGGPVFIGRRYVQRYRFSEQYLKDDKGSAVLSARIKMRRMFLNYSSSGYFRVEVTPFARDKYTYVFSGKKLGYASLLLGTTPIESGTFMFPVQTSNLGVTIDIINDSPFPATFQSAEWEGEMTTHSSRR